MIKSKFQTVFLINNFPQLPRHVHIKGRVMANKIIKNIFEILVPKEEVECLGLGSFHRGESLL